LYRPRYPDELFSWLAENVSSRDRAWDCGTGSGQAAVPLSANFGRVIASDPSEAQITEAERRSNIDYVVMTAERCALRDECVSLVTVAQALHWFVLDEFYNEVRRVLLPDGVVAVWTYNLLELGDTRLDAVIRDFHSREMGPWWPAERALVDAGYADLRFPFTEMTAPRFNMQADWTLEQLAGYVSTWSAVGRFKKAEKRDPVPEFIAQIGKWWGDPKSSRTVRWPLELRAGTV
jgi:SAM-dependent methyltransferase